jgi:cardiolipin synthase
LSYGLPVSLTILVVAIPVLWWTYRPEQKQITMILGEEVPLTANGKRTLAVIGTTLLLWLFGPTLGKLLALPPVLFSSAAVAGIAVALLMLTRCVNWNALEKGVHWGVLLLLGGGLSLGRGLTESGAADWLAGLLTSSAGDLPLFSLLLVLVTIGVFATELISNTAVTAKLAPILMGVALQLGLEADSLVVPVAIATSMAFMLPVATPPQRHGARQRTGRPAGYDARWTATQPGGHSRHHAAVSLRCGRMSWFNAGWLLLDLVIIVVLIPVVILQRRESGATLAWLLAIVLIPFLGLLAFWVFGTTRLHLRRRKRRRVEARLAPALHKLQAQPATDLPVADLPPSLLQLAEKLDKVGPQSGNEVVLFRQGPVVFDDLEAAFDSSRHHIHLVYYIWEPDRTGERLRDALMRACRRGVEVRLLLDDVGSRSARQGFFQGLVEAGGRVERFLPVNPLNRQLALNNRNHRKIVVVDGETGFTGGMNVGDVYAGLGEPWRDLHARICGPVVHALQELFCQDWYHATGDDLVSAAYFPQMTGSGNVWAQLLASGPADERWRTIHTLLFAAINLAREQVWVETPYFVPDPPIVMALQTAALRERRGCPAVIAGTFRSPAGTPRRAFFPG